MTIRRSTPQQGGALSEPSAGLRAPQPAASCLTTDEILELLLGTLPEAKRDRALEHIASCGECRLLFSSAARALEDTGPVATSSHVGAFRPGTLVADRYRVERFLARGGMGEVYAVQDTVLNERAALKTVRAQQPNDLKAIRRLKSEVQLSRRIGHPNTCRIFEFGEHETPGGETICFLTMELVEGETLGARLRREGPLPIELVRPVVRQLLGGLAEAHGLGIVHRDLKSDNIMLREPTAAGLAVDAVIMDFGLALRMDAEERLTSDSHALIGSMAYMAPEQVEGEALTPATDVYAFGVILFEVLTGQLPFRAATPASAALLRLHCPPPLPSSLRPQLDSCWDELVGACLERRAERRFASAREVLAALEQPHATRPSSGGGRRLPRGVWAVLGVAVAGLAIALMLRATRQVAAPSAPLDEVRQEATLLPAKPAPAPRASESSAGSEPPSPTPPSVEVSPSVESGSPPRLEAAPAVSPPGRAGQAERNAKTRKRAPPPVAAAVRSDPEQPASPSAPLDVSAPSPPAAPAVAPPASPPSPLEPLPLDPEFPE